MTRSEAIQEAVNEALRRLEGEWYEDESTVTIEWESEDDTWYVRVELRCDTRLLYADPGDYYMPPHEEWQVKWECIEGEVFYEGDSVGELDESEKSSFNFQAV